MKTFVSGKIHGIKVTDKSVSYHGSVSICPKLMAAAGIQEYEQVHVINLNNGNRWVTYAIHGEEKSFTLNGGARLGELGDECVVLSYSQSERMAGASIVFCEENEVSELGWYASS